MAEKRQTRRTRADEPRIQVQVGENEESDMSRTYSENESLTMVVKLRRTFPSLSFEEGKAALRSCDWDMTQAAQLLGSQQQIVIEDSEPVGSVSSSASPPAKQLKRKAADFSNPLNDMVIIAVGKGSSQQVYTIHRDVLCDASPWIEAELNKILDNKDSLFIETKTPQLHVEFTAPYIFGRFQKWIYHSKISDTNDRLPPIPHLVSLWTLAEKLQVPALQNHVTKILFDKTFCEDPKGFNFLYQNTSPSSMLRKLFVDSVVVRKLSLQNLTDILEKHWDDLPQEMLRDIILAQKLVAEQTSSGNSRKKLKLEDYKIPEKAAVRE